MKNSITVFLVFVLLACDKDDDKIKLVTSSLISGQFQYVDAKTAAVKNVPKGTRVTVIFNSAKVPFFGYSFNTTDDGVFSFRPTVEGTYDLVATFTDSMVQFNPDLVVPDDDLDSTRTKEFASVTYKDSVRLKISDGHRFVGQDLTLKPVGTGLKLTLKDEKGNTLKGMRVCIYDNQVFADANSPYCGGSIAYLSSDENGQAFFANLHPKEYFVVARGNVGSVSLSNQYQGGRATGVLTEKIVNPRDIILK